MKEERKTRLYFLYVEIICTNKIVVITKKKNIGIHNSKWNRKERNALYDEEIQKHNVKFEKE